MRSVALAGLKSSQIIHVNWSLHSLQSRAKIFSSYWEHFEERAKPYLVTESGEPATQVPLLLSQSLRLFEERPKSISQGPSESVEVVGSGISHQERCLLREG
jgi:hypothetical protein